eukprot:21666-Rhodomonas_salina.1
MEDGTDKDEQPFDAGAPALHIPLRHLSLVSLLCSSTRLSLRCRVASVSALLRCVCLCVAA